MRALSRYARRCAALHIVFGPACCLRWSMKSSVVLMSQKFVVFCMIRQLAKEYGVLFCPIKNKSLDNGLNDILFPASAAASVNRVLEHLGYPVPREKAVEVKKEAARGRSGSASQTRGHGSDSNARTTATERPSVRAAIDRLQKQARTQTDNAVRTVTRDEPYFEL